MDYKKTEAMFKALGDENRIKILELLKKGERCGCGLLEEMKITQSTLSHHMRTLCDTSLVQIRKDGKRVYYFLSDEGLTQAKEVLEDFLKHSYEVLEEFCDSEPDDLGR